MTNNNTQTTDTLLQANLRIVNEILLANSVPAMNIEDAPMYDLEVFQRHYELKRIAAGIISDWKENTAE